MITQKLIEHISERVFRKILSEVNGFGYANGGDEYYTRGNDVASILHTLSSHLSGKVVYCPCDDPAISNFYKELKVNYKKWNLRGLYTTWMDNKACFFDGEEEHIWPIMSGRFQDTEDFFNDCDVVITNPPFSDRQPQQMLKIIEKYGKEFILVGPKTLTQLQSVFRSYVRTGKMRTIDKQVDTFNGPDGGKRRAPTAVYTSFDDNRPFFYTGIKYDPNNYLTFDNSNAIDCGSLDNSFRTIPDDYYGEIAISANGSGFLRYLNPEQFDIISDVRRLKRDGRVFKRAIIKRKK